MNSTMKSRLALFPALMTAVLLTSWGCAHVQADNTAAIQTTPRDTKGAATMPDQPKLIEKPSLHESDFEVNSLAWSPDGKFLAATGILTRKVRIWDVQKGRVVKELATFTPTSAFGLLAYSPDGNYLAACQGGYQAPVRIWNVKSGEIIKDLPGEAPGSCESVVFSPDGKQFAFGMRRTLQGPDKAFGIALYNATTWQKTREFRLPETYVHNIAFSPDGSKLAIGGDRHITGAPFPQGVIELWDIASAKLIKEVVVHPRNGVISLAFNPNGQEIVSGFATGVGFSSPIRPGSKELVGQNNEDAIRVWNITSDTVRTVLHVPLPGEGSMNTLRFAPHGRWLVAGTGARRLRLFDGRSYELLDQAKTPAFIADIAISPDASLFAAANGNLISIWAPTTH